MISEAYVDALKIHDTTSGVAVGGCALSGFTGLDTGLPREDRPSKARRHGLYDLTTYYEGRAISLAGLLQFADWDDLWSFWDDLSEALALNGLTTTLKFRRFGESFMRQCDVTVAGSLAPEGQAGVTSPDLKWGVDLVAGDPRLYKSGTANTFTFASTGTITNAGNFSTLPVITFNSPGVNPGIRNTDLTVENEINFVYGGGGTALVVDVAARSIMLDGVSRPDLIKPTATDFWSLVSGANHLQKIGGATSITVAWRDAWV